MNGNIVILDDARAVTRLAEIDRIETDDYAAAINGNLGELHSNAFRVVVRAATKDECISVGRPSEALFVITTSENSANGGSLSRFIARYRARPLPAELGAFAFLQCLEVLGEPLNVLDLPVRGRA